MHNQSVDRVKAAFKAAVGALALVVCLPLLIGMFIEMRRRY
jgi:hypothetical protein